MPQGISMQVTVAAQMVRLSEGTIKGAIRAGRLKAKRASGKYPVWLIEFDDLASWFNSLDENLAVDKKVLAEMRGICAELDVAAPVLSAELEPEQSAGIPAETAEQVPGKAKTNKF